MKTSIQTAMVVKARFLCAALLMLPLLTGTASAQQIVGRVTCSDTTPATPLEGITVIATNLQGGFTSALTDSNGNYAISISAPSPTLYEVRLGNLSPGLVCVMPSDGFYFRLVPLDTTPADFVLTGCGEAPPTGEIGDRVWEDLDGDGLQDPDEWGVPFLPVQLTGCNGEVLDETTTDADGFYSFTGLAAGDYAVRFAVPPGYTFSPSNQGLDPEMDSDADPATGTTLCITLEAGQTDMSWDAGLCPREAPGVRSQGYWKTHPEAWPIEEIEIGGMTLKKCTAIRLMQRPTRGNKWLNLFEQLVAAKLNVYVGNESNCIEDILEQADEWLEANPIHTRANSRAWKCEGQYLHSELDAYNNGYLCAPPADG